MCGGRLQQKRLRASRRGRPVPCDVAWFGRNRPTADSFRPYALHELGAGPGVPGVGGGRELKFLVQGSGFVFWPGYASTSATLVFGGAGFLVLRSWFFACDHSSFGARTFGVESRGDFGLARRLRLLVCRDNNGPISISRVGCVFLFRGAVFPSTRSARSGQAGLGVQGSWCFVLRAS
jgi:hypothetical protein